MPCSQRELGECRRHAQPATADSGAPGNGALLFHAIDGGVVLLVALALLIVSFFAKVQGGVRWAVIVLVTTIVQIGLGSLSHLLAAIGAVHGAVALVLFGMRRWPPCARGRWPRSTGPWSRTPREAPGERGQVRNTSPGAGGKRSHRPDLRWLL